MPHTEGAAAPLAGRARLTFDMSTIARGADRVAAVIPWRPWSIVGLLVVIQWAAVVAFALTVRHNGWLYYQGGDETWYYTSAWALGTGHLPVASIGWGLPVLFSPIAAIAGPDILNGIPAVIVFQIVILQPLAILSTFSIGRRIGGRMLGYLASATWIAAPFAAILVTDPRYHERWVEQFLPQALGLTGMGDFASLVVLLAAAAFILRTLEATTVRNCALTGVTIGFAIGVKPSNAVFLVPAVLTFVVARRFRGAVLTGVAMLPAIVTLMVWKQRGLGALPLFALDAQLLAAGSLAFSPPPGILASAIRTYVHINWHQIDQNLVSLREYFWSSRVYQVLPFVGLAAALRRSLSVGVLLGCWFGLFFVLKSSNVYSTIDSGSFFRMLMPGLPAYVLLAATTPLLVPGLGGRLIRSARSEAAPAVHDSANRRRSRGFWAALVVATAAPLILVATAPHLAPRAALDDFAGGLYNPVTTKLTPQVTVQGQTIRLAWTAVPANQARSFYRVQRWKNDPLSCDHTGGTSNCSLFYYSEAIGPTRDTTISDTPGPGKWWYVVTRAANWLDDTTKGDPLLSGLPVAVEIPPAG